MIIASKRAKQLLYGAEPKIKSKFRNLIRIAQEEIEQGVIGFDLIGSKKEDAHDVKDEVLIGQELKNQEGETEEEEESDDDLGDEAEEK